MGQARERRGHLGDTQVFSGSPPSAERLLLTEEITWIVILQPSRGDMMIKMRPHFTDNIVA